jgi:hypothetical protein
MKIEKVYLKKPLFKDSDCIVVEAKVNGETECFVLYKKYLVNFSKYCYEEKIEPLINLSEEEVNECKRMLLEWMRKYPFQMEIFLYKFNELYEKLYDEKISKEKESNAMNYFDERMTSKQKELLTDFIDYRSDLVISDRECKAFVLTLEHFDYGF